MWFQKNPELRVDRVLIAVSRFIIFTRGGQFKKFQPQGNLLAFFEKTLIFRASFARSFSKLQFKKMKNEN